MKAVKVEDLEQKKSNSPLLLTGILFLFLIVCYSVGVPRSSFLIKDQGYQNDLSGENAVKVYAVPQAE